MGFWVRRFLKGAVPEVGIGSSPFIPSNNTRWDYDYAGASGEYPEGGNRDLPIGSLTMKKKFEISEHRLVPKHTKLSDKEKEELLGAYQITNKELPKIKKNDPAIASLEVKEGDVIKIVRPSLTSGESIFYRGVVNV